MSIQGIRRIRQGKITSPERTIRAQILKSKERSNIFTPVNNAIRSKESPKASINSGLFEMVRSTQHPTSRHRKTGSLGFGSCKEKEYYDLVSNQLIADLPVPSFKKSVGNSEFASPILTSRRSRAESRTDSRFSNYDKRSKTPRRQAIGKHNFELKFVVGKGGFGKVWKVKDKKTAVIYAMKEMLKTKIIVKKSVDSVMNQNSLLQRFSHPFLVNMTYAFQDREYLYLIMDYINGGDLRYHIGTRRRFSEGESKFFIACILTGLQYLHKHGIMHRDIKPENLVFDDKGYLRVTDLGISRECRASNASDTSGTPGYMAPEVITKNNHGYAVDFFAVGVIAYELMNGKRPYIGKNRQEIREHILSKQAKVQDNQYGWSDESIDFINRLLIRKQENRLGARGGISEVKNHKWFQDFDWTALLNKQMKPPYVPQTIEQNYDDYRQCISEDSSTGLDQESKLLLTDPQVQLLFEGYDYTKVSIRSNTPGL